MGSIAGSLFDEAHPCVYSAAGRMQIDKFDYYLVEGYSDDSTRRQYLDSFVEKNKDQELGKYGNYAMVFYKRSKQTTVENITANKKVIDRYSNQHGLIYEYHWSNGDFLARYKLKNGTIVEPKNDIRVEDTPKEKTGSDSTNIP